MNASLPLSMKPSGVREQEMERSAISEPALLVNPNASGLPTLEMNSLFC